MNPLNTIAVSEPPLEARSERPVSAWRKWSRGISSAASLFLLPLGRWSYRPTDGLASHDRLDRGLVIILPGIQGKSCIETSLTRGLLDGGAELAIEVHDWTTGYIPLLVYHICALERNLRQAARLADRITQYQNEFPGRPVHVIGHSGGAALALFTLRAMASDSKITSLILLAPAIAHDYGMAEILSRVQRDVWSFYSPFDITLCGLVALTLGTLDRRHTIAAGARGFTSRIRIDAPSHAGTAQFHQRRYHFGMTRHCNFAGHFGWVNRVFTAECLAPLIRGVSESDVVSAVENPAGRRRTFRHTSKATPKAPAQRPVS